jgi:hypothetical protein
MGGGDERRCSIPSCAARFNTTSPASRFYRRLIRELNIRANNAGVKPAPWPHIASTNARSKLHPRPAADHVVPNARTPATYHRHSRGLFLRLEHYPHN